MSWLEILGVGILLLVLGALARPEAAQPWKASCVNGDPTLLVGQLNQNGATEVIVLDRPHGRSDNLITSSNRICLLFR